MKKRIPSTLKITAAAIAAQWFSTMAVAQDYPPVPPVAVRLQQMAQAPAPVVVGPALPAQAAPTPVSPTPVAPTPLLPTPVPPAPAPDDLPPADPSLAVPDADVEAFARGPVHEAFADVYDLNPVTNEVIAQAPPAVVDELPPEQAPTGENVQWISGYWSWDSEAKDYLWVSGVWRDVPPGRRWVPGYWATVTGGYQWIGGFWADAQVQDLSYVPQPPASLEVGPNVPAPGDDYQWVPGNWVYASNNYQWSPGYYMPCQTDYMWVPCQYTYTPRGYVFVPGYRDYRFARRGVLFSPVRFRRPLYAYGYVRPAYYRPRFSIGMSSFMIHLFVRPRCRTFYFGDYYGSTYASIGFSPWYRRSFVNRRYHDPALSFYRWDSHRRGVDFDRSVSTWHQRFESNNMIRPPRTFHDQDQFMARHRGDRAAELAVMSHKFDDVVKSPRDGASFRHIDRQDFDLVRENFKVNRSLETARRQWEHGSGDGKPGDRQPGQITDLRLKDAKERGVRMEGPRDGQGPKVGNDRGGDRSHGPVVQNDKLKLNDLPEKIKERTHESVTKMDRGRHEAGRTPGEPPATGKLGDSHRPNGIDRGIDHGHTRGPGGMDRDRPVRGGKPDAAPTPSVTDRGGEPMKEGGAPNRPDSPKAAEPNDRRDAAAARQAEIRQNAMERRHNHEAAGRERVAPTPDAVMNSTPHGKDRTPPSDGAVRERPIRERDISPRIDTPAAGTPRQPVERAPRVDRTPVERAPVERAPRQVERQAPVERAPRQVERQAPVERAPRQMERHAPVERAPQQVDRAPAQRHAPAERRAPAERAPRHPGGGGGGGHRKGHG